jgi:hypothetical protein
VKHVKTTLRGKQFSQFQVGGEKEKKLTELLMKEPSINISHRFTNQLTVCESLCTCCPKRGELTDYLFAGTRSQNFGKWDPIKTSFEQL